jgi:hypothetical protein
VGRFLQPGRPSVHLKVAVCTPRPGAVSKASDTLKGVGDESEPPSSGGVASSGMAGAALICLAPCPWQSVVVDADRSCRPAWQRLALSRPDHHVLGCRTLDATTQPQWASGTPCAATIRSAARAKVVDSAHASGVRGIEPSPQFATRGNTGHHDADSSARLDPVKALRFAPTTFRAYGLDRLSVEPRDGIYVMAGRYEGRSRKDRTMRDISPTPNNPLPVAMWRGEPEAIVDRTVRRIGNTAAL